MSESRDFEHLMAGVEKAEPSNPTPLLVMADWCDENEKADLAYALRWCTPDGFRPFFRAEVKRYPWEWLREQTYYRTLSKPQVKARAHATLPAALYDVMNPSPNYYVLALKTCRSAYTYLADGLKALREIVEYGDLPPVVVKPSEVALSVCRECGISRAAWAKECPVCKATGVLS